MVGVPWSAEELADLDTLTYEQFTAKHGGGRAPEAWERKRTRHRAGQRTAQPAPEVTSAPPGSVDPKRLIELFAAWQEEEAKLHQAQQQIAVTIPTDRPVGVCFMSDFHIGGHGVDHPRILADLAKVVATPGLWVVLGGDLTNSFVLDKLAHAGRGDSRPAAQWAMARLILTTLAEANKLICVSSGNHDDWITRVSDLDPVMASLRGTPTLSVPYIGEGGKIVLTVGTRPWTLYRKHRGRSSIINPLHPVMAWLRNPEFTPAPDVIAFEHFHNPAIGTFRWGGVELVGLVTGSYKVHDPHARAWGHFSGGIGTPVVVLWPDERKMLGIAGLDQAADVLSQWW